MRSATALALTLGLVTLAVPQASMAAGECHSKPVKARGGPGLIEATAKSRARSAWIKKVRADRKLGPAYAAWLRAEKQAYACHKSARRIHCEAQAVPCKLPPAEPAAQPKHKK